jgi:hypothetical protein
MYFILHFFVRLSATIFIYVQRLALKRLVDISIGVLTLLSEQSTTPLPHVIVLVTLDLISSDSIKIFQEGSHSLINLLCFCHHVLDWIYCQIYAWLVCNILGAAFFDFCLMVPSIGIYSGWLWGALIIVKYDQARRNFG